MSFTKQKLFNQIKTLDYIPALATIHDLTTTSFHLEIKKYANKTALSKYVWKLKEKNRNLEIQWSIKRQAKPYTSGTKTCNLCLSEKMAIFKVDKKLVLNKRSELISKCRQENKFYTSNVTWTKGWFGNTESIYFPYHKAKQQMNVGGFQLHKWCTNGAQMKAS